MSGRGFATLSSFWRLATSSYERAGASRFNPITLRLHATIQHPPGEEIHPIGGRQPQSYSYPGAGVAKLVDATDLSQFECSPGNRRCRTAQIRGNLSDGNPEPSPETGRCRD